MRKDFCDQFCVCVMIPLQGKYEVVNSFQAIDCVEIYQGFLYGAVCLTNHGSLG